MSIEKITEIINSNDYHVNKNVISFINDDNRPYWSKQMDLLYSKNKYSIGRMYSFNRIKYKNNLPMQNFYKFIENCNGIIVDLASGPSGYFGPVLDVIEKNSIFVITDGSKTMVNAHSTANLKRKNVVVCELDLNKELPFNDKTIDVYCGNLLNNVDEYESLIDEVSRTIKENGYLVLIEWFFENGSSSEKYLKQTNKITQTKDYFIDFMKSKSLILINEELESEHIGKMEGDVLPIDKNEKVSTWILYFRKITN